MATEDRAERRWWSPWALLGVCLFSTFVFFVCYEIVGDGPEGLILIIPAMATLAIHVLLGPIAIALAWRREQHFAFAFSTIYGLAFAAFVFSYWADSVDLEEKLSDRYLEEFQPATHELIEAVNRGRLTALELERLLRQGADLNVRTPRGTSLLVPATLREDTAILEMLLDAGMHLDSADAGRALASAVRNTRPGQVAALLAAGAPPDGVPDDNQAMRGVPLCIAVNAGIAGALKPARLDYVEQLLAAGADPNHLCGKRTTAYQLSIAMMQLNALDAYRTAGFRYLAPDDGTQVQRALENAVRSGDAEAVIALMQAGAAGERALWFALDRGEVSMARLLLDNGVDTRARPYLTRVVGRRDKPALTSMLLEHGADPAMTDERGRDALAAAGARPTREMLAALIAAGADPDTSRVNDEPLLLARMSHVPDERNTPLWLLELGANPNVSDERGKTPLMEAARMQSLPFIAALAAAEADARATDIEGRSVIHHSIDTADRPAVIERLVALGASPERRDLAGETPYCLSVRKGRRQVMAWLEARLGTQTCEDSRRR